MLVAVSDMFAHPAQDYMEKTDPPTSHHGGAIYKFKGDTSETEFQTTKAAQNAFSRALQAAIDKGAGLRSR